MIKQAGTVLVAVLLCGGGVACSGGEREEPETTNAASIEAPPPPQAPVMTADTVFDLEDPSLLTVPEGLTATPVAGEGVRLSGTIPDAPATQRTGGAHVTLTSEVEGQASGRTVTVKVVARPAGTAPADLAVAYSTAGDGNSGWQVLSFSGGYAEKTFTYDVPARSEPGLDFIGLMPQGEDLIVAAVGLDIAE